MRNLDDRILYTLDLNNLVLTTADSLEIDVTFALSNGRTSYVIFEHLIRMCTGLKKGTKNIDHEDFNGKTYEQKSYKDPDVYKRSSDKIHTAASTVFANNSRASEVKSAIANNDYATALKICRETGYAKNDFYIYTNTAEYRPGSPFKYFVVSKALVVKNLSKIDPRYISRKYFLDRIESEHAIDLSV